MKKTVHISEPDARLEPEVSPDPPARPLTTAAVAYKNATLARAEAATRLAEMRQKCADAERVLADADSEVTELRIALAKAALE